MVEQIGRIFDEPKSTKRFEWMLTLLLVHFSFNRSADVFESCLKQLHLFKQ